MEHPRVLIVSGKDDPHAALVAKRLREDCDCPTNILAMTDFPETMPAVFEVDIDPPLSAHLDGIDLRRIDSIWWRRPGRCRVSDGFFAFDPDFLQIESDHFLEGLLWSTSCRWVNHPAKELLASRKVRQLTEARNAGLAVPRTLITNSRDHAARFFDTFGRALITKRIGTPGGQATRTTLLTANDRERLHTVETCPTLLQEYVQPAGDLRIVVAGGDTFAFWIDSATGIDPVDSRLDLTVEHRPFVLPDEQRSKIRDLLNRLGLCFAVIDMRVSQAGEYYFLEVNPSGQFLYLEFMTGVGLSTAVAQLLAPDPAGGRPRH